MEAKPMKPINNTLLMNINDEEMDVCISYNEDIEKY